MGLWWLAYKRNERIIGVVIISAVSLTEARTRAAVNGIDKGKVFAEGHLLDSKIAAQVPESYCGRMLLRNEAMALLERIQRGVGNVR